MALHRRAPRRDDSERAIIEALRGRGCTIVPMSGPGVPDLLIGAYNSIWFVCEVKTGKGDLTPLQRSWMAACRGPKPYIVRTPAEALAALDAEISRHRRDDP